MFVELSHDGAISTITVNRPDKLNALDKGVLLAIEEQLKAASTRPDTRVVIVTGAGKAFVAGADIAEMQNMTIEQAREFSAMGHRVFAAFESAHVPVIAAVNGFALGGGCELALACDFIYASDRAKFGQPEVKLGVIPGFGGTQRLLRRVGIAKARELVFTGAVIDAAEAHRIGLADAVFPAEELMPKTNALAQTIAQMGPVAVAHAKRVMRAAAHLSLDEANRLEIAAFAQCFGTSDQKEGMAAFVEKRAPKFTGR